MRLSSRLSDKSKNHGEIESFIDWEKYTISPEEETEDILAASQSFVEKLDALQDSLTATKIKVSENKAASNVISDEFADLYAKLG